MWPTCVLFLSLFFETYVRVFYGAILIILLVFRYLNRLVSEGYIYLSDTCLWLVSVSSCSLLCLPISTMSTPGDQSTPIPRMQCSRKPASKITDPSNIAKFDLRTHTEIHQRAVTQSRLDTTGDLSSDKTPGPPRSVGAPPVTGASALVFLVPCLILILQVVVMGDIEGLQGSERSSQTNEQRVNNNHCKCLYCLSPNQLH